MKDSHSGAPERSPLVLLGSCACASPILVSSGTNSMCLRSRLPTYDEIIAADARAGTGLVHCGLKALSSLRMEKGYRDYGHDLDNTDTLLESGLGFTADYDKEGGFIGKRLCWSKRQGAFRG